MRPDKLTAIWKLVVGTMGGILSYYLGGWDTLLQALVTFVVLDVITGSVRAFIQKKLSSDVSFRGIIKKALIFIVVAVGFQVDLVTGTDGLVRNIVAAFYCASEGLSILENVVAAGLPVPDFLREALAKLKEEKFKA